MVKRIRRRELQLFAFKRMRSGQVARLVTHKKSFEGNRHAGSLRASDSEATTFKEISAERSLKRQQIIDSGPELWVELIISSCEELIAAQSHLILEDIGQIADKVGNTVSGSDWSFDLFLDGLEKMALSFDDSGNPNLQLIVSREALAKMREEGWKDRSDFKSRFDAVVERKRAEWSKEEAARAIID